VCKLPSVIFTETKLRGAFILDLDRREDERGFFARTFCAEEFKAHGLNPRFVQCSLSFTKRKGTLRGMHWQSPPRAESKLIRCGRGAIHDVIIDLRPHSETFQQHIAVELTAENRRSLYVPEGFAHGFQTLVDEAEVVYQMSESYSAEATQGVRWNDPAFGIAWPLPDPLLNERDRNYPDFSGASDRRVA